MTSLEDAYVNMAREEERHFNNGDSPTYRVNASVNDNLTPEPIASRTNPLVDCKPTPTTMSQLVSMTKRRFRQFVREPRMWFLLGTPFVFAVCGFVFAGTESPTTGDE